MLDTSIKAYIMLDTSIKAYTRLDTSIKAYTRLDTSIKAYTRLDTSIKAYTRLDTSVKAECTRITGMMESSYCVAQFWNLLVQYWEDKDQQDHYCQSPHVAWCCG